MRSNELGAYVERLRTRAGWSQKTLGEKAGVSLRWITYIERGTWQSPPSDFTLSCLAEALQEHPTRLSELLHRDRGYPPAEVHVAPLPADRSLLGLHRGAAGLDQAPSDKVWPVINTALQLAQGRTADDLVSASAIADLFIPSQDLQEQLKGEAARLAARALVVRGICGHYALNPSLQVRHDFEAAHQLAAAAGDRELSCLAEWHIAQFILRRAEFSNDQGDYGTADRLFDLADDQFIGMIQEQEKLPERQRSPVTLVFAYTQRSNIVINRGLRPHAVTDFDAMRRACTMAVKYANQATDRYAADTRQDGWLCHFVTCARSLALDGSLYYHARHGDMPLQDMRIRVARARREMPDMPYSLSTGTLPYVLGRRELWFGDPATGVDILVCSLRDLDKHSQEAMHWRARRGLAEARDSDRLPSTVMIPCPTHGEILFRIVAGPHTYRCTAPGCRRVLLDLP